MKKSRMIVLGIAAISGIAAIMLMGRAPPPPKVVEVAAPKTETDDVLSAARELLIGTALDVPDLAWQPWPKASIPENVIRKSQRAGALTELKGAIVARSSFLKGEPIREDKLITGRKSGFLSANLQPGYRAVAITIDQGGATTAGGFILPNDRVDVIRTAKDDTSGQTAGVEPFYSQTILANIRVLAIGDIIQEKNGEKIVKGTTATLELEPVQAEIIIQAQRVGQLSLSLRSLLDAVEGKDKGQTASDLRGLSIVRYGTATTVRGH